jgi:hypothetical protein
MCAVRFKHRGLLRSTGKPDAVQMCSDIKGFLIAGSGGGELFTTSASNHTDAFHSLSTTPQTLDDVSKRSPCGFPCAVDQVRQQKCEERSAVDDANAGGSRSNFCEMVLIALSFGSNDVARFRAQFSTRST